MFRVVQAHIHAPSLALGSTGPGRGRARASACASCTTPSRDTDGVFDESDQGAVLAFQKVNGLERTGEVTPALWTLLARRRRPEGALRAATTSRSTRRARCCSSSATARSRSRRTSRPARPATRRSASGASTASVVGWDWVLWYPSYFLRGFAIHGYPSVPAYPASHGCVRVPMWLAPRLYEQIPMGSSIYIYA